MNRPIYDYFAKDHERLEGIFEKAVSDPENIDEELYHTFRTGLLKHIKMEEKVLFPAAQKANGGEPLPMAAQLRLEHGALTSLMVTPPDPEVVRVIDYLMDVHDRFEEEPGGVYDLCDRLTKEESDELIAELDEVTEVPVHPHNKADFALTAAKRALQRAGYDFDEILQKTAEAE